MSKLRQWLLAGATLAYGRRRRRRELAKQRTASQPTAAARQEGPTAGAGDGSDEQSAPSRIVPAGPPDPRGEYLVVALLAVAALFAAGFIVVYAFFSPPEVPNQLLGVCIGGALGFIALALAVFARRLIVTEEVEEDYPQENPEQQRQIAQLVRESGSRLTRRRLLVGAAAATGGTLGLAGLAPVLSLGPLWDTAPLDETPWRRGRRLVDAHGDLMLAADVEEETFYTAFAQNANPDDIASILVVLRLHPSQLRLPAGRQSWAPNGILAYSKICTHAGCAVALYRKPRFPVLEPKPALVCPCHYSTFDPATGATVIFGPAGRPLPQLPLMVDTDGYLAAAGDFSGRVGPAWWGVREGPA
jgi:ubiquinol-cytochrome c reductase iron-sulfur subunit